MTRRRAPEVACLFALGAMLGGSVEAQPAAPDAGLAPSPVEHVLEPPPEEANPEIESSIAPRDGLSTGDVVTWTLRVRSREADDVTVIDLEEASGGERGDSLGLVDEPVHLLDRDMEEGARAEGRRVQTFSVRYLLLAPGEHELPSLAVRVLTADGQLGFVTPKAPKVTVASVVGNEPSAEPKPPTDPVEVMEDDPRPLYALAVLAAMAAGALLAFAGARWWKKRAARPAPPPPPRAPWLVAEDKLDALRRSRTELMDQGRAVEWADGLSDAIREYLGARYGFDGLESTTDEVLERLRDAPLGGITVTEIAALLQESDLVKFAKAPIDDQTAESLLDGSYRVVRATRPAQPDASRPASGGAS